MPTPVKFLHAFGFIDGSKFDGYILKYTSSSHKTIRRYQEYEYDIELKFKNMGNGNWDDLFNIIVEHISNEYNLKGVRNLYRSIIDYPKHGDAHLDNNGDITIYLIGHSYRI